MVNACSHKPRGALIVIWEWSLVTQLQLDHQSPTPKHQALFTQRPLVYEPTIRVSYSALASRNILRAAMNERVVRCGEHLNQVRARKHGRLAPDSISQQPFGVQPWVSRRQGKVAERSVARSAECAPRFVIANSRHVVLLSELDWSPASLSGRNRSLLARNEPTSFRLWPRAAGGGTRPKSERRAQNDLAKQTDSPARQAGRGQVGL